MASIAPPASGWAEGGDALANRQAVAGLSGDAEPKRLTLFFDGGCRPNPGPMETAVVVRGAVHVRDDLGSGDNNEAEWLALLHAVELAVAAGAADVLLVGDSVVVVEQARGRWRCRSAHLQPYLAAFRTAVADIPRVRLKQVPRSRNLAGIALARRNDGVPQSPHPARRTDAPAAEA